MISLGDNGMRVLAFCALFLTAAHAEAGELLVMPYTCEVEGGQPQLTPSQDQGYAVVGHREERDFSTCSPADPTQCRHWKIHRFDIECGGRRVPWASVVANARGDGRAWLEGGHLNIAMPARWGMSPDDPCARETRGGFGWGYRGRFARYCAERRAHEQPPVVQLPEGFAPMASVDGIFVADGAPRDASARVANGDGGAMSDPAQRLARPKPQSPAPAPVKETAPAPSKAPPAKPMQSSPPAEILAKAEPAKPTVTLNAPAPPSPPLKVDTSHLGAVPTIINGESAADTHTKADTATVTAAAAVTAPQAATPESAPPKLETGSLSNPRVEQSAWMPAGLTSVRPVTVGAVSLVALGLMALTVAQWRSRQNPALMSARDIGALSLDRPVGRELVATSFDPSTLDAQAPTRGPSGFVPSIGDEIPRSREQALHILGMGVAGNVSDMAIKKIVDGLRMSWHPDGATTAEERELRELRIKQINAAWDILNGRRAS